MADYPTFSLSFLPPSRFQKPKDCSKIGGKWGAAAAAEFKPAFGAALRSVGRMADGRGRGGRESSGRKREDEGGGKVLGLL